MHIARRPFQPLLAAIVLLLAMPLTARQDKSHPKDKASKENKAAAAANLPAVLWRDPGDISSLDLVYGSGGKEHAPRDNEEYKFIKEDLNGTSTKFYVEDGEGVQWLVKLGPEAKPETAATRFVWAMGYFVDEDYYLERIHVAGIPKLRRGNSAVSPDGTILDARLKRQDKGHKKIANWDWFNNPFVNTRELNGLRTMMALINNWDLTTLNNKIYNSGTERQFVVSDLGASFGKTGGPSGRSKGVPKDYAEAKFIEHAGQDFVDFQMATRPFPLVAPLNPGNYEKRSHVADVAKHIPSADAQWIGQQLSRLTPQQIRDAFRAAGYAPGDVEEYTQALQARIARLNAL